MKNWNAKATFVLTIIMSLYACNLVMLLFDSFTNTYMTNSSQILPHLSSGFAAGTYYTTTGGGANYLCMTLDPEYNEYAPGGSNAVLSGRAKKSFELPLLGVA